MKADEPDVERAKGVRSVHRRPAVDRFGDLRSSLPPSLQWSLQPSCSGRAVVVAVVAPTGHHGPVDEDLSAERLPAHRPSRRAEILEAAIKQFARKGFVDTAISDVAEEAGVAVTAIYYHFSGKEELYGASVSRVFEAISSEVGKARSENAPADAETLGAVIDVVWDWIDEHPDEAALLYAQLPGGTRQVTTLRQEFEEQHIQRAFVYFGDPAEGRTAAGRRSVETMTARTLVDLLMSVHTMRLADGPLSTESNAELRKAVHRLAGRLVEI